METTITQTKAPTFRAEIFIAGDYMDACRACREFVMRGACVSVSPAEFIYTGGAESGVRVLLINYPRFPASSSDITALAIELSEFLIERLFQSSASVVSDSDTIWLSRRTSH